MLSASAITYSWKQILYRLGLEAQENSFTLGSKPVYFSYSDKSPANKTGFFLKIQACPDNAFEEMIAGRPAELTRLSLDQFLPPGVHDFPFKQLPVIFWGTDDTNKFAEIKGRTLTLHADILAATFFMLSRYEEVNSPHLDKHGRYQYSASVTSRYDLIDLPIVDVYALVLKTWLEVLTGEKIDPQHKFRFQFSHDVDYLTLTHPLHKRLVALAKDLVKGRPDFFRQDSGSLFSGYWDDRYFRDLGQLVEIAQTNHLQDVFYMLTSQAPFSPDGYSLQSRSAQAALAYLKKHNMQIGLHASYQSYEKPELYAVEKQRLDEASGTTCRRVRQHFLRIRTPFTWNAMQAAGLEQDESYTFSEHEGFRCGTCYPYQVFDVLQDRELDFSEQPLIVMDASLRIYRKLSVQQGEQRIMQLAQTCRKVNGTFSLLWHNTSLGREWQEWGEYLPNWVKTLAEMAQ